MKKTIAIDTETTGKSAHRGDRPFIVSFSDETNKTMLMEWKVDPYTRIVTPKKSDIQTIQNIFDADILKVFWNAKFDLSMLASSGVRIDRSMQKNIIDVNLMARIYKTNRFTYGLKPLSNELFHLDSSDEKELKETVTKLRKLAKKRLWKVMEDSKEAAADYWLCHYAVLLMDQGDNQAEKISELVRIYAERDAIRTMLQYKYHAPHFEDNMRNRIILKKEHDLMWDIMEMEATGVKINTITVANTLESMIREREELDKYFVEVSKKEKFNANSGKQLGELLFSPLGFNFKPLKLTPTGQASTDDDALSYYASHEIVQKIYRHKTLSKGIDFYSAYEKLAVFDPVSSDFILNATFNQTNTRTFRLSCSDPNLQQVSTPKSSKKGNRVIDAKAPFEPRDGHRFYLYDYSGQELRIFGKLANVEFILRAIREGRDLNDENANKMWGGKNNFSALHRTLLALELDKDSSTEKVIQVYEKYGIDYRNKTKIPEREKFDICEKVLEDFDWKIVSLEKSMGKSNSRTLIKIGSFCILYGGGVEALMKQLNLTYETAEGFRKDFNTAFPEMGIYQYKLIEQVRSKGYIITPYERKIHVDAESAYKGVNYSIQATAADCMKGAMLNVGRYFRENRYGCKIVLTIHDEIVVEIEKRFQKKSIIERTAQIMESEGKIIGVPMPVEINRCDRTWSDEKKFERCITNAAACT